jgi:ADP-ribosylglycohydrolase
VGYKNNKNTTHNHIGAAKPTMIAASAIVQTIKGLPKKPTNNKSTSEPKTQAHVLLSKKYPYNELIESTMILLLLHIHP